MAELALGHVSTTSYLMPMPEKWHTWWGSQAAPAPVAASGEGMSPQPANNGYV